MGSAGLLLVIFVLSLYLFAKRYERPPLRFLFVALIGLSSSVNTYALTTPTLTAPSTGVTEYVGTTLNFTWSAVSGATGYELEFDAGQSYAYTATATTASLSWPIVAGGLGSHTWQVRAKSGTTYSAWSSARTYTVAFSPITLVSPANGSTVYAGSTVIFSWTAPSGATAYDVEFDPGTSYAFTTATTAASLSWLISTSTGNHTWHVRAKAGTSVGDWSATQTYTSAYFTPSATAPANGAIEYVGSSFNFTWTSVAGVTGYDFEYDPGTSYASTVTTTTNSLSLTPAAQGVGPHTWQVRSKFGTVAGPWSVTANYSIAYRVPNLTAPANNSTQYVGNNINFTWSAVTGASSYDIEFDAGTAYQSTSTSNTNSLTTAAIVGGLGPHTWQVRAKNGTTVGSWSAAYNYTVSLYVPVLSSPAPAYTAYVGSSINFAWSAVSGATSYEIEFDAGTAYQSTSTSNMNSLTTTAVVGGVGPHTWQVRAKYNTVVGPWSSYQTYTVVQQSISLTSPNGGENWIIGTNQNITWTTTGITGNVKVEINGQYPGNPWETLFSSIPASNGSISWPVTGAAGNAKRIRITSIDFPTVSATSNANFSLNTATSLIDTVHFSNLIWNITNATVQTQGPSNNYWSADKTKSVWVDKSGFLHLKIIKDPNNPSKWYCAQVQTQNVMGAGTYQFEVEGAIDQLNENVVFGMFSYPVDPQVSHDGYDEIDIEYSKWGSKLNSNNFDYVVYGDEAYPAAKDGDYFHTTLSGTYTTQRYIRTYNNVTFQSLGGFHDDMTNLYQSDVLPKKTLVPGKRDMPVLINLWLYNGGNASANPLPPSDGQEVEIIIHNFKFIPNNCSESFEPNDNTTTAYPLIATPLNQTNISQTLQSVISTGSDQDWYAIPIDGKGTLKLDLSNLPANYDLELYPINGLAGGALKGSYNTGTTSESITYAYTTAASTILYAKVYPKDNTQFDPCNKYSLALNWTPSGATTTCTTPSAPTLLFGADACASSFSLAGTTASLNFTGNNSSSYSAAVSKYPYETPNLVYSSSCQTTTDPFSVNGLIPGMVYRWNMFAYGATDCSSCKSPVSTSKYFSIPPVISSATTQLTTGGAITLSTTVQTPGSGGGISYRWLKDGQPFNQGSNLSSVSVSVPGTYTLINDYTGSADCSGTTSTAASNAIIITGASGSGCTASTAATGITQTVTGNTASGPTIQLTQTGGSLGTNASWHWYRSSCGGTPVGTGASITISPTVTDDYFVRAEGDCGPADCFKTTVVVTTGCTYSIDPTSITASVNNVLPGTPVTLTVNGGSLNPSASWYLTTGSCGGTPAGSGRGTTFNVAPTVTTTYYLQAVGGCNSGNCVSVTVNVLGSFSFSPIPAQTYGAADFTPAATGTGPFTFSSSNTAVATIVAGKIHITRAGSATISASDGSSSQNQQLTVSPAPLTITAGNQTRAYGSANPALTVSYSGFVNGETAGNLTTAPNVQTTASISSPAGTYPITASGAVAANYTISYVAGTLTISAAQPPTLTAMSTNSAPSGTPVTLTGTNLGGATAVSFGGTAAASFTINSATSITAIVAGGTSGNVSVTTPGGTATLSGFTYIFSLPVNNFTVAMTSASCRGSSNGSIGITAVQALNYTATITGSTTNYSFSTSTTIPNLAAGTYTVCIMVAGQSYQQCYTAVISEPKDLALYVASINPAARTVDLLLTGGDTYHISLNSGPALTTSQSNVTLNLQAGSNHIVLTSDKPCQAPRDTLINLSANPIPYPVPFEGPLNINLGPDIVKLTTVTIYSASNGAQVFSGSYINRSGVLTIDLSTLRGGIYELWLNRDQQLTKAKISKP